MKKPQSSQIENHKATYLRLKRAILNDQMALLECRVNDGNSVVALVSVTDLGQDLVEFQPFAVLLSEADAHQSRVIAHRHSATVLN